MEDRGGGNGGKQGGLSWTKGRRAGVLVQGWGVKRVRGAGGDHG